MNRFFLIIYPWDAIDKKKEKKKNLIGTFLMMFFSGIYSLTLLSIVLKKILPIISKSEYELLGKNSIAIRSLDSIFSKGWEFAIIFTLMAIIYSVPYIFTLEIRRKNIRTFFSKIRATREYYDSLFRVLVILSKEFIICILIALANFVIAELLTLGLVSIFSTLSISIVLNSNLSVYGFSLTIGIFVHILIYPTMNVLYYYIIIREKKEKTILGHLDREKIDFELENWRELTWGKKGYSYDWKKEEYAPFICPNCNSVISSNLVICPICGENVVKLLEKVIEEESTEEESTEKKNEK